MSGRPTWAGPADGPFAPPAARAATGRPPARLVAAAIAVVAVAAGQVAQVVGRDDLGGGVRAVLLLGLALQAPLAALALRRSPVAAMALLLYGVGGLVAALAAGDAALAVGAGVVLVLLAWSLPSFPSVEPWSS